MEPRNVSYRSYHECCVCGLSGQKSGFTPISHILPNTEGNTTKTITSALGLDISPSSDGLICEPCHLKIFNFKTFALECSKRKHQEGQFAEKAACKSGNLGISQGLQGSENSLTTNNRQAEAIVQNDVFVSPRSITGTTCSTSELSVPPSKRLRDISVQLQTVANGSSSTSTAMPFQAPLNIPPGTVMMKKEKSSVYIFPDGTTFEVLNRQSTIDNEMFGNIPTHSRFAPAGLIPKRIPQQSNANQSIRTTNVTQSKKSRSIPGIVKPARITDSKKTAVIVTDTVQVPTLLVPKAQLAPATSWSPIQTNDQGKVAIPRIQRPVRRRAPPMLLPKVSTPQVPRLKCPRCEMVFLEKAEVRAHLAQHPEIRMCSACDVAALGDEGLLRHVRAAHPHLLCPAHGCTYFSTSVQLLKQHIITHSPVITYECTTCGKTFNKAAYLRIHKRQHNTDREKFKCHICDKLFKSKISLRYHLQFHEVGFNKCLQCNKKFQFKESLRRHEVAMHGETALFACDICNQRCADRQSQLYHMRTHNKEKYETMACPMKGCSFRAFYQYRLRRHIKRVHEKDGKAFSEKKEKICPFCDIEFTSMDDHLKEGQCQMQVQNLIQEIISRTADAKQDGPEGAALQRHHAERVLQECRTRRAAGQHGKDLDSATLTSHNEFFEDLMRTINKLQERLRGHKHNPAIHESCSESPSDIDFSVEDIGMETGMIGESSSPVEFETEVVTESSISEDRKTNLQTGDGLVVLPRSETDAQCGPVTPEGGSADTFTPPTGAERHHDGQDQEVVTPIETQPYQEIIVEGDNVTEEIVELVETALQNGDIESGTSYIIVDETVA